MFLWEHFFSSLTSLYSHKWSTITLYLFSFNGSVMSGHLLCTIRDYKYIDIMFSYITIRTERSVIYEGLSFRQYDWFLLYSKSELMKSDSILLHIEDKQMLIHLWMYDRKFILLESVGDFILTKLPIFLHILTPTRIQGVSDWSGFVC